MRIMAADFGDVRTGVALSDLSQSITGGTLIIENKNIRETAQILADEAKQRDVACIVIGYPKNMDGTIGERAKKSEQLADMLKTLCEIDIKLWDERLTTVSAHKALSATGKKHKKHKKTIDAVAASMILESYLNSLKYA